MDLNNEVLENPIATNIEPMIKLTFTVNEEQYEIQTSPTEKLIHILREQLNLAGTKISCGIGRCGACSVLLDGELVNACLVMAYQVNGKSITTIEGIGGVTFDEVQEAFLTEGGFQCGYCTSGMIIAVKYLLALNPTPTETDIKEALAGNLCRCTGYGGIIRSVQSLSAKNGGI
ncbi:(2Fe-2S)-binding protein [Lysinibacillus sp. SGAir0095]|uniref:(2Fe-2S)-binding protein n=1 Tax=Lysinibacillus sp. SGAir0095 TaxID=2070463 RepID=UPI0010CCC13C|nr:(2Fe-2S)-binding protein [Lysinibacillus sp. SGAir0095]QCR32372.1 xanthine dehydrogenase subunit E [Lysinibacillus sp. SGAir0095]